MQEENPSHLKLDIFGYVDRFSWWMGFCVTRRVGSLFWVCNRAHFAFVTLNIAVENIQHASWVLISEQEETKFSPKTLQKRKGVGTIPNLDLERNTTGHLYHLGLEGNTMSHLYRLNKNTRPHPYHLDRRNTMSHPYRLNKNTRPHPHHLVNIANLIPFHWTR